MLVEVNTLILDGDGEKIKMGMRRTPNGTWEADPTSPDATLKLVVKRALFYYDEDKPEERSPEDTYERYRIASYFDKGDVIDDLAGTDADYIMKRAGQAYLESPVIYGRMKDYFDKQRKFSEDEEQKKK